MNRGFFHDAIERIVRLLPRPMMDGKLIAKSRNFWVMVEEYGEQDGIVVLNKFTNHEGRIPYDSIRKWQEPDKVILAAQVTVGQNGLFEMNQFLDGPESEMITDEEEILPARMAHAVAALHECTAEEIEVLKELLIKQSMEEGEIIVCCARHGIQSGYKFVATVNGRTSFLEMGERQRVWIKPAFVPILEKVLLPPIPS
jgi:hypothetical protein